MSWGPRARYWVEIGELEGFVRAFEAEKVNPRTVHLGVSEHYVSIVHARIHRCLRVPDELLPALEALCRATSDLHAAARIPLLQAHARVADAHLAWREGKPRKATKLAESAEHVATKQRAPWVLYAGARLRAHIATAEGDLRRARDLGLLAERHASEHGSVTRARWIREELARRGT